MAKEIQKAYNPAEFEDKIYESWEKSGYFRPEYRTETKGETFSYDEKIDGKPFVIMMPPPNVTGKLHVGHSLVTTLQDIMTRYHRLLGEPALWLPGMDHAGIATQAVVDKQLKKEGINRHELGREKFLERAWQWKEEYGGIILKQTRKMGASCDWSRERFTLDEGLNKAVNTAFVTMYERGLIYRGERVVNWCPKCHTAVSDDEVEHEEHNTKLYYFRYSKDFPITIATTRPETKLGDTGVAVNPNDKRYKEFIGKIFDVEIDGVKRKIKVFADRAVDETFGTGAVGVTPAHSAIDGKMAEDNDLAVIQVIDENGRMTAAAGEKYEGLKTKEASEKFLEYLKENGLFEKEQDYLNNLSICYRCGGSIEPIPSLQWFVKMKPLAEKATKAVKDGSINIIPPQFEKVYFHWMDNIRDWCISRQLWWGHRLPVWYRLEESKVPSSAVISSVAEKSPAHQQFNNSTIQQSDPDIYVGVEPPKDIENWVQDEDVLDTWFSSGLWTFSTLGWPEKTKDLAYFHPTTVLETAADILFFWVARMIMLSLELTGEIPFKTVYLNGLVRDEHNRKMSKSLGNALDPLDVIDKYGTDALRMALVVGTTAGQDMALGEAKIKGYRNFSNKAWNASRFVILRVSGGDLQTGEIGEESVGDWQSVLNYKIDEADKDDKWIWDKHQETIKSVTAQLDKFRFSQAGEELYEYFWHEFCDKYIEQAKEQLNDEKKKEATKLTLVRILAESLILLHPFAPFVTEAAWHELRKYCQGMPESIMIATWPKN